jgi:hypothetical protein
VFYHHSKKTANINVKLLFSFNSGVIDNHRSKTAIIKGVNLVALNTPPGPHEHFILIRNRLICKAFATVLVSSNSKRISQGVLPATIYSDCVDCVEVVALGVLPAGG